MSGGWSIGVTNMTSAGLLELYQLLKTAEGSRPQALEIQKELVARARAAGLITQEILDSLTAGAGKSDRMAIAKEWSEALGVSEAAARKLVS